MKKIEKKRQKRGGWGWEGEEGDGMCELSAVEEKNEENIIYKRKSPTHPTAGFPLR